MKNKRTNRKVRVYSISSESMYGSIVLRSFLKNSPLKRMFDKRKTKRRIRRAVKSSSHAKFVI